MERVVRRDYADDEYESVIAILNEYGTDKWHREPTRVRLAILKVADGNLQKLRRCIDGAKQDYRDALAAAEYPVYSKIGFGTGEMAEKKRQAIEDDWQQYEEWLRR